MNVFDINKVYPEFKYPKAYLELIGLNCVDFGAWYFMSDNQVEKRIVGLRRRYPHRKLIPFARRDDNDDIACFELEKDKAVQLIHDYASAGYEQRKEYPDIWAWLHEVMAEKNTEEAR